jgi:hypothetical protein
MACDLTLGRKEPCKDVVGGIKAVYFADFGDWTVAGFPTYISGTDVIDTLGSGLTVLQYDVKGNSSFEQNITSSRENGTTFFEQTLNLTLHKLTKEDNKELKLMAYGRPHILVEDYNSNVFVMGLKNGADVSGGTIITGAAMGDLSGYTLTFSGMEAEPANFLENVVTDGIPTTPATQITNAGVSTITAGTNS